MYGVLCTVLVVCGRYGGPAPGRPNVGPRPGRGGAAGPGGAPRMLAMNKGGAGVPRAAMGGRQPEKKPAGGGGGAEPVVTIASAASGSAVGAASLTDQLDDDNYGDGGDDYNNNQNPPPQPQIFNAQNNWGFAGAGTLESLSADDESLRAPPVPQADK